jgi:membrane-bound serine protease (ClpP class)
MNNITLLILLLTVGMLLIGAEIFLPGAVLGVMGAMALLGAIIVAFSISLSCGFYTAFGIFILTVITVALWVKFFPRSSIGRKMTLDQNGVLFKATESHHALMGRKGTVCSALRPAGYAMIEGRRVDVISEGGIIDRGEPVEVIKVEGSRVIVRKSTP